MENNRKLTRAEHCAELAKKGLATRRAKATTRRAKVKALRNTGLNAPQIAAELNIKVRLVRQDFSILNKEAKEAESDEKSSCNED